MASQMRTPADCGDNLADLKEQLSRVNDALVDAVDDENPNYNLQLAKDLKQQRAALKARMAQLGGATSG